MAELAAYVLTLVCIYVITVVPLNLMMGYGGLTTMAGAAFFGIGAYTIAIASTRYSVSFIPAILLAVAIAAIAATAISVPFLRLRDEYFIIATLAFQVITTNTILNWGSVTNGALGIFNIPRPELFGLVFRNYQQFALLALLFALLSYFVSHQVASSPIGLLLRGIREDESAAEALGKDVSRAKVLVSIFFAGWAAIGGALYAYIISAIDPAPFTIHESIFLQSLVIVGGSGNLLGSLLGAAILVPLPVALRFLDIPPSTGAEIRNILYGLLLVLVMRFRPQGLVGERTVFLRPEEIEKAPVDVEAPIEAPNVNTL